MGMLDLVPFDQMTPEQYGETGLLDFVGSGIVAVTGRTGDGVTGTAGASTSQNSLRTKIISPRTPATGYHGVAIKCSSYPVAEKVLWQIIADDGSVQLSVTLRPAGTVSIYDSADTLLGTSTQAFVTSSYRYLQLGHTFTGEGRVELRSHPSSGVARVLVVTGATSAKSWVQETFYLDENTIIDDFQCNDGAGPAPNTFAGDTTLEISEPTDVTWEISWFNNFMWMPNSGVDKVAPIDETAMDSDSTYLHVARDLSLIRYNFEDEVDDGRTVTDVMTVAIMRKTSSDTGWTCELQFRRWDGIVVAAPFAVLELAYKANAYLWANGLKLGPGLGTWTAARYNDSQFGVNTNF